MRKEKFIILGFTLILGSLGWSQCVLRNVFYDQLTNWPAVNSVPLYVHSLNPPTDWTLEQDGAFSAISDLPGINDLGEIHTSQTLFFTVQYHENACDTAELSASASTGVLTLDSLEQVGPFVFEAHYRFSSDSEGSSLIDIELVDSSQTPIATAQLGITITLPPEFNLTVNLGTGVTGTPSVNAIYDNGTVVPYSYSPETCFENLLVSLDGQNVPASGNITMDEDHDLQISAVPAIFQVEVISTTGGSTNHDGINDLDCGDNLSILAQPGVDHAFSHWSGDVSGTQNPLELVDIQQDYQIQANFVFTQTNLFISSVAIIQGITMSPQYRVHIAGRNTIVRVYTGMTGTTSQAGVNARMTRYVAGVPQGDTLLAMNGPRTLPVSPSEGSINDSLNFDLPASWLVSGTTFSIELDPGNAVFENNETDNRYPASGEQNFNFQVVDSLDIVIVPIQYTNASSQTATPNTSNLSYLTWMPKKVYPIHQINYTLHSQVSFSGNLKIGSEWNRLLSQITGIHSSEDPGKHKLYFGLVNFYSVDGCTGGCIAGLGWVGQPTCIGFSGWGPGTSTASETFTHEMGHNFGRSHAPCGGPSGVDPGFPYSGGTIGNYGLDTETLEIYSPLFHKDYMGYCNPNWTSDYTYKAIYEFRELSSHPWKRSVEKAWEPAIYFGGIFDDEGSVLLTPNFKQDAPTLFESLTGNTRIELLDGDGDVLLSQSFESKEVGDMPGSRGFGVFLPDLEAAVSFQLYHGDKLIYKSETHRETLDVDVYPERKLLGGKREFRWAASSSVKTRIRITHDEGQSWKVLGFDHQGASIILEAGVWEQGQTAQLEIQFCLGLSAQTYLFDLD